MARSRWRHTLFPIGLGFGCYGFGRQLEQIGDMSRLMGQRTDAQGYHLGALVFILIALTCFIVAGVRIVRAWRSDSPPPPPPLPRHIARSPLAPQDDTTPFDPDAIMAHYLAQRPSTSAPPVAPSPAPGGFGRKRI